MASINRIFMAGRLARDPESKEYKPGLIVCKTVIATEHATKSKNGTINKEVCYIDCSFWNKDAEKIQANYKKGSVIVVEGRLKQEKWIDKTNNSERTKHVLVADRVCYPQEIGGIETAGRNPLQTNVPRSNTPAKSTSNFEKEVIDFSTESFEDLPF